MKRRALLRRASATVAVGAVAGCLSDPGEGGSGDDAAETNDTMETDSEETTSDRTTEQGTTRSGPPEMTARSISTTNTDCRSSEDPETASVSFGSDQVDLSGVVTAPDPCHEAAFESVGYDESELVVVAALSSSDGACMECEGIVEYEGSVGFDSGVPETVVVKHESRNETRTVTTASP
jgi:hypothetical protein